MRQICNRLAVALQALVFFCAPVYAEFPDYEREARLTSEAEDGIFDGDSLYLEAEGRDFLGVFTESALPETKGAVLVMHGRGFHPDWPQVANPVRVGLSEAGWATLSIQMPVLKKDATYYEYLPILDQSFPRIEAGIEYLKSQGYVWIALLAHSCSVHMSMAWIRNNGDSNFDAYIGIGMGATDYRQPMHQPFPLDYISVPILDVYGSEDYPAVVAKAVERDAAIQLAGNPKSMQSVVEGADHFFEDYEESLVEVISNWLDRLN